MMDAASGDETIRLLQEGKVAEADAVLSGFGFQHRIAAALWNRERYPTATNNPGQTKQAAGVNGVGDRAIAWNGVLPPALHDELKTAFGPSAPFWRDHGYPTDRFFSYNMPITGAGAAAGEKQKTKKRAEGKRKRKSQRDLIGEAVDCIRPLVEDFMEGIKLDGGSVEWWAHIRSGDNAAGHQLHFDLDEARLLAGEGISTPEVSSVLYLAGEGSAATLVTDECIVDDEDTLARDGMLCSPKPNRLLLFEGSLMHGVIPVPQPEAVFADLAARRVTLMFGWWPAQGNPMTSPAPDFGDDGAGVAKPESLGPNMKLPKGGGQGAPGGWLGSLKPDRDGRSAIVTAPVEAPLLPCTVWEAVATPKKAAKRRKPSADADAKPGVDTVPFVGKFFVRDRAEIREEALRLLADGQSSYSEGSGDSGEDEGGQERKAGQPRLDGYATLAELQALREQ